MLRLLEVGDGEGAGGGECKACRGAGRLPCSLCKSAGEVVEL
jgi:hypothetical protein